MALRNVIPPSKHTPTRAEQDHMASLCADNSLVELDEIAHMFGVGKFTLWNWWKAARNYLYQGWRIWPPSPEVLRSVMPANPDAPPLTGTPLYPAHAAVLPPPITGGEEGIGAPRWRRGDLYAWGFLTRRLTYWGEPQARMARARTAGSSE
jgi:hypothetical protein